MVETELVDINNDYGRFHVCIEPYFIVYKTINFLYVPIRVLLLLGFRVLKALNF